MASGLGVVMAASALRGWLCKRFQRKMRERPDVQTAPGSASARKGKENALVEELHAALRAGRFALSRQVSANSGQSDIEALRVQLAAAEACADRSITEFAALADRLDELAGPASALVAAARGALGGPISALESGSLDSP